LADPPRPEETLAPREGLARIIVTKQYLPSTQLVACPPIHEHGFISA
jgi:hypothetical protein